jgi:cell division protein FtsB
LTDKPKRTEPAVRSRVGQLSGVQIMFAAILAIGLILGINFSSRIAAGQPLQDTYVRVQQEIVELRQTQSALIAERDYVQSTAYVEQWARDEGKMVREGEVLVIPVPAGVIVEPTPIPASAVVEVETSPPEPETWMIWWALFFDTPPPQP